MRDLRKHPITSDEIVKCLTALAEELGARKQSGDIRPLLLQEAARMIRKAGDPTKNEAP
jgi:hypothetical protein